ncbi:type II and III secretion system protein family protein [Burkholderia anthina]|uniref:type II and III secretion system protein family protein n=1 Tax=Burkholderia anthina TaxID=179879 RepID=UPI0037BE779A
MKIRLSRLSSVVFSMLIVVAYATIDESASAQPARDPGAAQPSAASGVAPPVAASAAVGASAVAPAGAAPSPAPVALEPQPAASVPPPVSAPLASRRTQALRRGAASVRGDTPDGDEAVVDSQVPSTLYMYKGQVKVIPIEGRVKRVAVGNGDLLNVSVVDHQLLLLAQAPGDTSLVVWRDSGIALKTKVSISAQDRAATLLRLQRSLGFVEGLRIDPDGGRFIVRGNVHPEQADLVKQALGGLPDVVNLIETEDGSALKKTVHFKMSILEISKSAERNLGIAWDQQINGPQASVAGNAVRSGRYHVFPSTQGASFDSAPSANGGAVGGVFLGIATSIFSKINLLMNNGDAYLLAEPELNSRSGGKATFLSGGEVPIPVSAGFGAQDVIYKEYGIRLEIAPTVDTRNIVSADLLTEISQIDPTVQVQGYPAFLTRRTTSQLSLRPGETLAIAGLINAEASTAIDKLPALGDIPILGHLFKSTDFRNNKSDLVVLVTPYVVDTASDTNTDLLTRGSDMRADYGQEYGNPSPLPEANERRSEALREEERKHRNDEPQPSGTAQGSLR